MSKKSLGLLFICFILLNLSGCAGLSGRTPGLPKGPKLIWNVSYIRGLVIAKEALADEKIQFGNAVVSKDAAELKGNYADGRTVQMVISKTSSSESSLVVQVGNSQTPKEDVLKILEIIEKYSKRSK